MKWSGVEWSGVEWSGVEWSGVEWSGVESRYLTKALLCPFLPRGQQRLLEQTLDTVHSTKKTEHGHGTAAERKNNGYSTHKTEQSEAKT